MRSAMLMPTALRMPAAGLRHFAWQRQALLFAMLRYIIDSSLLSLIDITDIDEITTHILRHFI
jgi:hypothetical protein